MIVVSIFRIGDAIGECVGDVFIDVFQLRGFKVGLGAMESPGSIVDLLFLFSRRADPPLPAPP